MSRYGRGHWEQSSNTNPGVGVKVPTLPVAPKGTKRKPSAPCVASASPGRTVGKNLARAAQPQGWNRREPGRMVCGMGQRGKTGMGRNHERGHRGAGQRRQREVHLPGSPNRCVSQAGACCIWGPQPRPEGKGQGFRAQQRGREEAGRRSPGSSCSFWEPVSFMPPGPRKPRRASDSGGQEAAWKQGPALKREPQNELGSAARGGDSGWCLGCGLAAHPPTLEAKPPDFVLLNQNRRTAGD